MELLLLLLPLVADRRVIDVTDIICDLVKACVFYL